MKGAFTDQKQKLQQRKLMVYEGCSSQTGTYNFTGIKTDANMAVLHAVVSGKYVLLLTGGTHVVGQSRDH